MGDLFKGIEKKTGVKMDDIMKVANSVKSSDLSNEKGLRNLIAQVSKLANKNVSKQTEDKIVETLLNKKQNIDASTISKMMGNNKKK
ncbi:stage VI sporulation protein F [Bacillus salitolerans]|uniref:Stage VI sporulation protein F n=1 Tax=Bacillus salitolerans TaxID=1437434 RepID=A0ABW4LPP6_9BACI